MRIKSNQISNYFSNNIPKICVTYGYELLINLEINQKIRNYVKKHGYNNRVILFVDQNFDWTELESQVLNLSLFESKKLIEIRLQNNKLTKFGSTALEKLTSLDLSNVFILITLSTFDRKILASPWYKAIEKKGLMVESKPIDRFMLPEWITEKLAKQKQIASKEIIQLIVDRVEGNLMAASQEIKKIGLLLPQGTLEFDDVVKSLKNVSRYDISDIGHAILDRDRERFVKIVNTLHIEGQAPSLILWAIMQEIRVLLLIKIKIEEGSSAAKAIADSRVWGVRKKLLPRIVFLTNKPEIIKIMNKGHQTDLTIKGLIKEDPWCSITNLGLFIIGIIDRKTLPSSA
ncbi:MAG: DNA polymerase III subunit delta [Proteobacteria bacterium]|nr:DNA polymerase III subunit delta [Pseudomonadota bacterium]